MGRDPGCFDEVADLYDQIRPGYPESMVSDLTELCRIGPDSRVLEIGPGTGQLTVPIARTGARVVAVEMGAALAAVARRNLADHPRAEVVTARFEDWVAPDEPFDLVVSATAFHWLDPAVRLHRCARVLGASGSLAVVDTHHVAGPGGRFETASQACYQRWDEGTTGFRMPTADEVPRGPHELDLSPLFGSVQLRRYERAIEYTADDYVRLLQTYSDVHGMSVHARTGLLGCLRALIDGDFGGRVRKHYLTELRIAGIARRA